MQQSYACATQVAVVLCPYLLTTEGSFDSPTAEPKCPGCKPAHTQFALFLRLRHPSMLSKRRFVSTGWEPKTKTKSIHFIASSLENLLAVRRLLPSALRLLCLNGPQNNRLRS